MYPRATLYDRGCFGLHFQVDTAAKDFTEKELKPAAKQIGDGAVTSAQQFRSTAEDSAAQVDDQGTSHKIR